jgi:hypothetical protein
MGPMRRGLPGPVFAARPTCTVPLPRDFATLK